MDYYVFKMHSDFNKELKFIIGYFVHWIVIYLKCIPFLRKNKN